MQDFHLANLRGLILPTKILLILPGFIKIILSSKFNCEYRNNNVARSMKRSHYGKGITFL